MQTGMHASKTHMRISMYVCILMNLDERVLIDGKILITNICTYKHTHTEFRTKTYIHTHTLIRSPHTDTKLINQSIENKQRSYRHMYTTHTAAASVCDWRCHEKVVQAYIRQTRTYIYKISVRPTNSIIK